MENKQFYLVSSNQSKLNEFKEILGESSIILKKGYDLREVQSNCIDVITYKVLELNQDLHLVEDTILEVFINNEWKELVDIKFLINKKQLNKYNKLEARWITNIGYKENSIIRIYQGSINGVISLDKQVEDSFGFDSFFIPKDNNPQRLTIHELKLMKLNFNYSARKKAILNFQLNNVFLINSTENIPNWNGCYQK